MTEAWEIANENLQKARQKMKAQYDKAAKESQVQVNDTVLLKKFTHKQGSLPKSSDYWKGEYKVLKLPDSHHDLILKPGQPTESARKVHLDQIKPLRIAAPNEVTTRGKLEVANQVVHTPELNQEEVNNEQINEVPTSSGKQFENAIERPQAERVYSQMQPTYDYTSHKNQDYYPTDQAYYNQYEPRLTDEKFQDQ